ncbi:MAG TPA: mandelate racemase/muconate lactonizing enzyme family protein [Chryseolinea sp.]|nr:mandelate racemase/muconate lactonizing enzyme family protein [Chryseolinea sp.]
MNSRRHFLKAMSSAGLIAFSSPRESHAREQDALAAARQMKNTIVKSIAVYVVKVNARGNWVFVQLTTHDGVVGIGEASHGGNDVSKTNVEQELQGFFELVKEQSPFAIGQYRQRGWQRARASRTSATAFSAIEQALWDIQGKTLGIPVHQLLGGKLRDNIKVYANINRGTNEKDEQGRRLASAFQRNAELAVGQGFKAIKMAPFDEMKPLPSTTGQIESDISHAIECLRAVRQTIGNDVDLLVDVHSHLNEALGIEVAKALEPLKLFWYEEAVNPQKFVKEAKAITEATVLTTAGGESVFGREGFAPLIESKAFDILMPDVKHCGGIQELKYIAAMAETAGLSVAPHNPSGPVASAASVAAVATIPNFSILELAYGEVPWRSSLIDPAEEFSNGFTRITDRPGFGISLNVKQLGKYKV